MRAAKVAAALFKAEHECVFAVLFPLLYLVAYKLEAYGHFEQRNAELVAYGARHTRRHERFYDSRVCGQFAVLFQPCEDIVQKEYAHLVARKRRKFAVFALYGNAQAVAVGVGAEYNGRANLFCEGYAHRKRLFEFGVGHFHGRKVGVFFGLFGNDSGVYAYLFEYGCYGYVARTVNGGIYQFKVFAALFDRLFREGEFGERLVILPVDRGGHRALELLFLFFGGGGGGEVIGLLFDEAEHLCGVFGVHLRAVFAVYLVSVVLLGVVRGGYHYARNRFKAAHREREHRHGVHVGKYVRLDAVCGKHVCRGVCEHVGFQAGVVRDDHAALFRVLAQSFYEFRKALGGAHYGVYVHHIRAVAYYAAQACRAELQFGAEAVFNFFVVILYGFQFRPAFGAQAAVCKPAVVKFGIAHNSSLKMREARTDT